MKSSYILFVIFSFFAKNTQSQTIDTLIDVGGYHLRFHIIKGKGIPILFEAGGGNDASIWYNILKPIADKTNTTLISYDRAGFGKSEIDTNRHTIADGVERLEIGLQNLGYVGNIMLVAHSYGGFYTTLFASRNRRKVKAVVLIDANHVGFYTDEFIHDSIFPVKEEIEKVKSDNWGIYFIYADFQHTVDLMRNIAFPPEIPVIDIVSDKTPWGNVSDSIRWKIFHRQFVDSSPNHKGFVAYKCGHYIFQENPKLVIDAIVEQYHKIKPK